MKTKILIEIAQQLLNLKKKEQFDQITSLKGILKELKKKKRSLKEKLANEEDKKKALDFQRKLDVISFQRKKGLNIIKKLKRDKLDN